MKKGFYVWGGSLGQFVRWFNLVCFTVDCAQVVRGHRAMTNAAGETAVAISAFALAFNE